MRSVSGAAAILKALPVQDPSRIYHLLRDVDLETILFSMAETNDPQKKKEISHFLVELRKVRPVLKGRDLKAIGIPEGPLYSKILGELLDERLRGRLKTEEDEKKFVLKHYRIHTAQGTAGKA